jgi:hypothetical protein
MYRKGEKPHDSLVPKLTTASLQREKKKKKKKKNNKRNKKNKKKKKSPHPKSFVEKEYVICKKEDDSFLPIVQRPVHKLYQLVVAPQLSINSVVVYVGRRKNCRFD